RSRMAFLRQVTPLHLFVVTLRCEHSCPYCQVSRQSTDSSRYDMSDDTAQHALRIAFDSPAGRIKIEFQGGEPLLNFPLIEKIVLAAERMAPGAGKKIDFVIASNLALLTDDHLTFCKAHDVLLWPRIRLGRGQDARGDGRRHIRIGGCPYCYIPVADPVRQAR